MIIQLIIVMIIIETIVVIIIIIIIIKMRIPENRKPAWSAISFGPFIRSILFTGLWKFAYLALETGSTKGPHVSFFVTVSLDLQRCLTSCDRVAPLDLHAISWLAITSGCGEGCFQSTPYQDTFGHMCHMCDSTPGTTRSSGREPVHVSAEAASTSTVAPKFTEGNAAVTKAFVSSLGGGLVRHGP